MMLMPTDEVRVVSAVLQFGPHIVGLMSDSDRLIFERAKKRMVGHTAALVEMMAVSAPKPKEPA